MYIIIFLVKCVWALSLALDNCRSPVHRAHASARLNIYHVQWCVSIAADACATVSCVVDRCWWIFRRLSLPLSSHPRSLIYYEVGGTYCFGYLVLICSIPSRVNVTLVYSL